MNRQVTKEELHTYGEQTHENINLVVTRDVNIKQ